MHPQGSAAIASQDPMLARFLPTEDTSRLSLVDRLLGLPPDGQFGRYVRTALGLKNYAHACADYGAVHGAACRLCGGTDPATTGGDWCVTDIIRKPRRAGDRLLAAILGQKKDGPTLKIDPRLQLRLPVAFRLVHDEPLKLMTHAPHPDDAPSLSSRGSAGYEEEEAGNYHPSQYVDRVEHVYEPGPVFFAFLYDDIPQRMGLWLLRTYGWEARKGGRGRRRYHWSDLKRYAHDPPRMAMIDDWAIVERAFEILHPDLAPPRGLQRSILTNAPAPHQAAQQIDTSGLDAQAAQAAREKFAKEMAAQQAQAAQERSDLQRQIDELKTMVREAPKARKGAAG